MDGTRVYGGFFEEGTTFGKAESKSKEWWVEMEGLNSLLLMHEKYGRETDVYFKAFQMQWRFIKDYQTDSQFHGVYETIGPDGVPTDTKKGRIWKAAYHDGRALLNVTAAFAQAGGGRGPVTPVKTIPWCQGLSTPRTTRKRVRPLRSR
jgi:mannose/cellobiose epimerase-like protein (N-acyl-D-glucosamine 2-epimerase family)